MPPQVLHDYLQHLHAFCSRRLAQVTAAWPGSFYDMKREMVAAQVSALLVRGQVQAADWGSLAHGLCTGRQLSSVRRGSMRVRCWVAGRCQECDWRTTSFMRMVRS